MGAAEVAATVTIPAWLWGAVGVVGAIVFTWMLGLISRLLGGDKPANGGGGNDCASCAQVATVKTEVTAIKNEMSSIRTGLDALNGRIDRILEIRAGGQL